MGTLVAAVVWGILLATPAAPGGGAAAWLAAAVLAGTLLRRWRQAADALPRRGRWFFPGVALLGVALGVAAVQLRQDNRPSPAPEGVPAHPVTLTATVAERDDREDSSRLWLVDAALEGEAWQPAGTLLVTLYHQPGLAALPGDRVRLSARLKPPGGNRVPGAFDYGAWLERRGVVASGYGKGPVMSLGDAGGWRWNRLRQRLSESIARHLPAARRGLVAALLVGKRGHLGSGQREALQATGIFHLVAISGLHLGLVAGLSFWLLRTLLDRFTPLAARYNLKPWAAGLALLPMILYALLAGMSLPTQRAAIMVGMVFSAVVMGRQHQGWRGLGVAALVILLWRPEELFNAGFQLSFAAVAILLALLALLPRRPTGDDDAAPLAASPWRGIWRTVRGAAAAYLLALLLVTLVLGMALAPLIAHHFHQLAPYGLLANLLAVPLVTLLATPIGLLALLAYPLSDPLHGWLLQLMGGCMAVVGELAAGLLALPGAWLRTPGPTLAGLGCYLAAGVGVLAAATPWRRMGWLALALAGLLWPRPTLPPGQLRLALLDVGQAQAAVIRQPDGEWSVVDAGGTVTPRYNVGEGVVSAYLWHHGATRLQRLVVSHPQMDHMAGAERVLRNFPTGELWLGHFPEQEKGVAAYARLLATARTRGTRIRRLGAGEGTVTEGLEWRVLSPPREARWDNPNNRSLALELVHGEQRIVLPADLEREAEEWLARRGRLQRAVVVVAPHHGSRSSSSAPLVAALRPAHVLYSVGLGNRFHFPAREVVARWETVGATTWRTDRDGTIEVISDGRRLAVGPAPLAGLP